jgi:hypothetical protein
LGVFQDDFVISWAGGFRLKGRRQIRIKKEKSYEKNYCSVSLLVRHAAGFSNR